MKNYLNYLKKHLISLITILFVSFLSAFFIVDIINQNISYYKVTFKVDNINDFNHQLLLNEDFLNEIKDNGSNDKYINIDVETMLEKKDFSYTINNNEITIKTKFKYYDLFFLSSNNSVGTRAKMFIKDSVLKISSINNVKVTFDNPTDIVSLENNLNRYIISVIVFSVALISELITCLFLHKKNDDIIDDFKYDNVSTFAHPFNKNYWREALKPLTKVKDVSTIAMLFALMLASKFIPIPSGFGNLGISFVYLFFAIVSMIYGPIYGFVIGVFSDIIGFFINSGGGVFNLGYTLQAALSGFVYGLCFYRCKMSFSRVFIARFIVNIFLNAIYGSFLFIFVTYFNNDPSMTLASYLQKVNVYFTLMALPKNIVYLLPQCLLLYYVLKITRPILARFNLLNKSLIVKKYK